MSVGLFNHDPRAVSHDAGLVVPEKAAVSLNRAEYELQKLTEQLVRVDLVKRGSMFPTKSDAMSALARAAQQCHAEVRRVQHEGETEAVTSSTSSTSSTSPASVS